MAEIPLGWLGHTVQVETCRTGGSLGDVFEDPVPVRCHADLGGKRVRESDGTYSVSPRRVLARLQQADRFTKGSKVTFDDGVTATVDEVYPRRGGAIRSARDHLEVIFQ